MHIAIDDTYGPKNLKSQYVTGDRRTYAAVVFNDSEVDTIREKIKKILIFIRKTSDFDFKEFHFVDIYNKNPPWDRLQGRQNLIIFETFAEIYKTFQWPVFVQTIDNRTLTDHGIKLWGELDGLDLSNRSDLALLFLLIKIKSSHKNSPEPITILVDEGRHKAGTTFGRHIFHDWPDKIVCSYDSSESELLLQVADFIAYCINRSTHLSLKTKRSDTDNWFLNLVGSMNLNCSDIITAKVDSNFTVSEFDLIHKEDRKSKGLE